MINPLLIPSLKFFLLGVAIALLLFTIMLLLYRKEQERVIKFGKKTVNLLAIIFVLLVTGSIGKWGFLPIALSLAFLGWQEFLTAWQNKYQHFNFYYNKILIVLGTLAVLAGLIKLSLMTFWLFIALTWLTILLALILNKNSSHIYIIIIAAFGMIFITLPLIILLSLVDMSYEKFILLTLLVMSNDGFSESFGQLLGKTPLIPEISPNKTVEGTLGGFICCLIIAYVLYFLFPEWQLWQILLLASITSVFSLIGDLIASSLKREVGIKDFGTILGATGGILDKFDSLMFATPIFCFIVYVYNYNLNW